MRNIRIHSNPKDPSHEDFDWMYSITPPNKTTSPRPDRVWRRYVSKFKEGWDFGIIMWGSIGRQEEVSLEMSSHRMIIRDVSEHGKVREIMNSIEWDSIPNNWMGAPNTSPADVIEMYESKKQDWVEEGKLTS